ncbi:hypothetical protein ACPPVU_06675 [Mucilaginibacter sp. McL0603]|uniref:hypothetical protein n=1 Tax=Mucilaginibacter sp. McL0603 TaxID=3415670 RepID=UPI003CE9B64D
MSKVSQGLKKHPAAITFYLLFCLPSGCIASMSLSGFKEERHLDGGLPYVFTIFLAALFIVVNLINAVFRKEGKSFYLWLTLILLIQTYIVVSIG